jgi:phosphinothricin acetyltransferase
MIRSATSADGDVLAAIYNHYVTDTIVTFEETPVSADEMQARIAEVERLKLPWLVAEEGGEVIGFAYAHPWRPRYAYRFSVESTVYLRAGTTARGIGTELYRALFTALQARGDVHAVIGGIALPNDASVKLHERLGMKKVAHFTDVGFKFGRWIDVAYWELVLG